jgi:hypothetical protein
MIRKVECGHTQYLQESDVILSINGKIITRISELDVMYDHDVLDVVIVRKCEEISLQVPTVPTGDLETNRAVIFCGAILHRPHHAVRQQISVLHSEVYVSARVSSIYIPLFYVSNFRLDERFPSISVCIGAHKLHSSRQWYSDIGPRFVPQGGFQNPRQYM